MKEKALQFFRWIRADRKRTIVTVIVLLFLFVSFLSDNDDTRTTSNNGASEFSNVTGDELSKIEEEMQKQPEEDTVVSDVPSPYSTALKDLVIKKIDFDFSAEPKLFATIHKKGGFDSHHKLPGAFARKVVFHDEIPYDHASGDTNVYLIPSYYWNPGDKVGYLPIYNVSTTFNSKVENDPSRPFGIVIKDYFMVMAGDSRTTILPYETKLFQEQVGDFNTPLAHPVHMTNVKVIAILKDNGVDVLYEKDGNIIGTKSVDGNFVAFMVCATGPLSTETIDFYR